MSLVNCALRAVLLASLILSTHAYADEFTVYGPDEFIRHYGQPIQESFTFTAPVAGSDYILRIHNGWGEARRVRAASIKLNGVRIFGHRDFHSGYMDHFDFDGIWSKEQKGKKHSKRIDKHSKDKKTRKTKHQERYDAWNLDETSVIDKSIVLLENNTIEVVLYGIPQKKLGPWDKFFKKIHGHLPTKLKDYLNKGSGLAVEIIGTSDLVIDDLAPVITATIAPLANQSGWHSQDAIISFDCSDTLSGIASCTESMVINQDGAAQKVEGTAVDQAGNTAVTDVIVNLDTTAPLVSHQQAPLSNTRGWVNQAVTVSYTCSDALSGISLDAGCPVDAIINSQGSNQKITSAVSDLAGNSATHEVLLNIDTTKPALLVGTEPDANKDGWFKGSVFVDFNCTDELSGIATCPAPQTYEAEGSAIPVAGKAIDFAGNQAAALLTLNIDKSVPSIVEVITPLVNAVGWHNSDISINYRCEDTLSGMAYCPPLRQINTEGAAQNITSSASDMAGNINQSVVTINLDKTSPTIEKQLSIQPNTSGWHNSEVVISYTCTDELSGVELCPVSETINTDGEAQAIEVNVSDKAGNSHQLVTQLNIDTNTPLLVFTYPIDGAQLEDPLPIITLDVSDGLAIDETSLQLLISDEEGSVVANCTYSIGVSTCNLSRELVGQVVLAASVSDLAGNITNQSISVVASVDTDDDGIFDQNDMCPTSLYINDVAEDGCDDTQRDSDNDGVIDVSDAFPHDGSESNDIDGDGVGDNSDSDKDGDSVDNGQDVFPEDPKESSDLDGDGIGDNGDQDRDGDGVVNVSDAYPEDDERSTLPIVTIDSPITLVTVGSSPVAITGSADSSFTVLTVNGAPVNINAGTFSAQVSVTEGHNTISVRAVDEAGLVSTASISVSLDLTPPYVTIDSHEHEQVVYSDKIMVSGLLNDIVRGTVEAEQASVTVNGIAGDIANRSYRVENVPLVIGENKITVIGVDQVGNATTQIITVIYNVPSGKQILIQSGQNQTAQANEELTLPLSVKVIDESGVSVANKNVVFRVSQGSGVVISSASEEARAHVVATNAFGVATMRYKVGQRAGVSNHKVDAKVVGYENSVTFYTSASGGIGNKLSVNSGNNQRGSVFQPLPSPFIVAVTDSNSNVVKGAQVLFEATIGGGVFENGMSSKVVLTDSDGRAAAQMTLGSVTGLDQQRITVKLIDAPEDQIITAGFTATGYYPQEPANTAISGSVLNNQDAPLPNVTVRVDGTTRQALTDAEGVFKITQAPVGPVHLVIDGSTTTAQGEYPTLSQNIVTVSGVNNPLSAPVYMVKLNTNSAVWAGKEDVEVTLTDVPGFKLEIQKDSVTFPDGSREGQVSVTAVNSSKVPMAPPNGMQPQFIVTIQPTGTRFDPPARLTMPNVDAYTPGAQVEMFSYDHDLEEFVAIGLGSVSDDGSVVKSNKGVGVIKAGWHCGAAPGGDGDVSNNECKGPGCNPSPPENKGPPKPDACSGNPINLATGEKYQTELDYIGPGAFPLKLERNYASHRETWQHAYEHKVENRINYRWIYPGTSYAHAIPRYEYSYLIVHDADGSQVVFTKDNSSSPWSSESSPSSTLVNVPYSHASYRDNGTLSNSWIYTKSSGEVLKYSSGRLVSLQDEKGNTQSIVYNANVTQITDQFGSQLLLTKNAVGNITQAEVISQNQSLMFTYEYDETERLVKATFPGNTYKIYHYENEKQPKKLTGITDESGVRFATWQYDNFGRAILSEHALEAERKSIQYNQTGTISEQDLESKTPEEILKLRLAGTTVTETNELGKKSVFRFGYFKGTRVTKVEGKASTSCIAANKEYTYNTETGAKISATDWNRNVTRYEYNDRKLKTLQVEAEGTPQERRIETQWHAEKPWVLRRNNAGQITEYVYDDKGHITTLSRGGRIVNFSYGNLGQLEKVDGPRTDVIDETHYEYSANGNLVRSSNALGHVVHLQDYNLYSLPTRIVDANGTVTLLEYDQRGRLSKSTVKSRDGDAVTSYVTNAVGLITKITPPNDSAISFEYDGARRLTAISNKLGERIEYSIDAMGNPTEERILDGSSALAYRHVNLFDELGRMIKDVGTNEQVNLEKYDANGNATESIDGNGNQTVNAFDPLDRLISSTDANNQAAQFAYDDQDNLTSVSDQRGLVTRYEYNGFNEIVKLISPDTGTTTFERDAVGNIIRKTDARGVVTAYTYDAINRVLSKTFPTASSRNISYRYDDQYTANDATAANYNAGKGRLTHVSDHSGSSHYRYDDRGNVIADSRTIKLGSTNTLQTTAYGYDLANRLTHIDYPTGIRLYFVLDNLSRTREVKMAANANINVDDASTIAQDIGYLPFGGVKDLTYGNGLNLNREFDRDYRISNIEVADALDLIYQYDSNNNIVAIDDALSEMQSADYAYDSLNRLMAEAKNENEITYEYDVVGNRIQRSFQSLLAANDPAVIGATDPVSTDPLVDNASINTYVYADNSNRLKTIDGENVVHDAVGNINTLPQLISQQTSGESITNPALSFTYDAVNRLSTLNKNGALQASYFYNAQGQRVLKQIHVSGESSDADYIVYHYNLGGQITGETHYKSSIVIQQKTYVWLGNMPLAMVDKAAGDELNVIYIHSDHLNTPRSASNEDKAVVWRWQSDAFGDGLANNDVDGDGEVTNIGLRFPGQIFDEESNKHYNYFRDYDPSLGRYVESDPIGLAGGLNTFSYVKNGPLVNIDLYGLLSCAAKFAACIKRLPKIPTTVTQIVCYDRANDCRDEPKPEPESEPEPVLPNPEDEWDFECWKAGTCGEQEPEPKRCDDA
jgi:RHS repeat-associated protein